MSDLTTFNIENKGEAPKAKGGLGNFFQRAIVAIIGIPIIVWLVLSKPLSLLVLLAILAMIAVHEFYGLAKAKGFTPQTVLGIAGTGLIALSFGMLRWSADLRLPADFPILTAILILLTIAVLTAELFKDFPNPFAHIAFTLSGALYIGLGLGAVFGVRQLMDSYSGPITGGAVHGGEFVVIMLASIWICDSAAYFGGKAMGKNKLYPRVSPNKTWEGAAWGFVFAFVTWFVARALMEGLSNVSTVDILVMGVIVGVFGQIGDLAESLLKRDAGVKDSGTLLPGHGGMYDRVDSILFVAPLTYAYFLFKFL